MALNVLAVIFQVDIKCYRGAGMTTYRWADLCSNRDRRGRTPLFHVVYSGAHYDSTEPIREAQDHDIDLPTISDSIAMSSNSEDNHEDETNPLANNQSINEASRVGLSALPPHHASAVMHIVDDDLFVPGHIFSTWDDLCRDTDNYCKTRHFRVVKRKQQDKDTGLKSARIICSRAEKPRNSKQNVETEALLNQGTGSEEKKPRNRKSLKCGCQWRVNLKGETTVRLGLSPLHLSSTRSHATHLLIKSYWWNAQEGNLFHLIFCISLLQC